MEFGLAFSYPFKDTEWFKKVAIIALVGLIPVIGQMVLLGWGLEVTRRVIRGDRTPLLPALEFGKQLGDGFKAMLISMVYAIPLFIIMLPVQLATPIAAAAELDSETMATVTIALSVCCGGLGLIYGIFLGFVVPAALGNMVAKDSLGAGFRLGEVFGLVKAAPVAYLLVLAGAFVGGIIAPLGGIACGIGALLTAVFSNLISSHLIGQAYVQASTPKM